MTRARSLAISLAPSPTRWIAGQREIGHLHQYRCVESWRAGGFEVFSVNAADEADAVRAAYPDIPVVVAERDMRGLCGRPVIPVSEMIRALRATGATYGGIAGADVRLADTCFPQRLVCDGQVTAILERADAAHPCDPIGVPDPGGAAALFFELGRAATLDLDPFAVGLPGWGSALAMALVFDGAAIVRAREPVLMHLAHPNEWGDDLHRFLFEAFRERFSPALCALRCSDRADVLPALGAIAASERHADLYADRASRHGWTPDLDRSARRHRLAYAAAVADLIRELSMPSSDVSFRS